jgi:predicted nucleic-acid-binding Zn-ribbon protein
MSEVKKALNVYLTRFGQCTKCGNPNLVITELQSTGKLYARPMGSKPITIFTTGVPVNGITCLDCGHLELIVSPKKMVSLVGETRQAPES